jgi:hypothetical protein
MKITIARNHGNTNPITKDGMALDDLTANWEKLQIAC